MRLPTATRNALVTALVALLDGGSGPGLIKIYTGSQPASANSASSGSLLATVPFSDPAFNGNGAGAATASGTPLSAVASGTGTAGWVRLTDSTGATVADLSAGAAGSGQELEISPAAIVAGGTVSITGGTLTVPAG